MTRAVIFVSRHFTAFAILAYLAAAAERVVEALLREGPLHALRANNLTQYFVNYPDHGFARRALVGTILRPLTHGIGSPELVVFWLMVAINLAGFAGVLVLANRLLDHAEEPRLSVFLRAALAIGSVGVVQIAHDYGRFDVLNFFVLGAGVWLALRQRPVLAALACSVGILIHEGFAIYAAPLIIAVAWQRAPAGRRVAAAAPAVLASAVIGCAILLFGGSDSAAALTIGSGSYVWKRGLIEINQSLPWLQVAILAAYWLVLLTMLVWFYRGNGKALDALAFAALCPLALNLFGIDHGRWVFIGFLVVVATLCVQVRAFGCHWPVLTPARQRLALPLALPLGPHGLTGAWTWLL